jgi:hypothetical protein
MSNCGSKPKKMKYGGPATRGGRAKVAGTKRRKMYKDIEDLVSQAMTGDNPTDKMYRDRSMGQKVMDKLRDTAEESEMRYLDRKTVQKKQYGGKVRAMKLGGAVMSGRGPKFKGQS